MKRWGVILVLLIPPLIAACGGGGGGASDGPNALNIDFGRRYDLQDNNYAAAGAQSGLWNDLVGTGTTPVMDPAGIRVTNITVVADDDLGHSGYPYNNDESLLQDNFFSWSGSQWEVTVSPLFNGNYDLYVYAPAHSLVPTGNMLINGDAVTGIPGNISTLVEGTSYIVIPITVTGNTLTMSGAGTGHSGLAGIQLVPK